MRIPYAKRLILHAPAWDAPSLAVFVEDCLRDGVVLVAVVGPGCRRVEDALDELVVADGSDPRRVLNTTAHPDESLCAVRRFASAWLPGVDPQQPVEEVRLPA